MTLDSDDSDSSAGKIVHKSTSHSDDSPKGTEAAAFSFSDCKKFGEKLQFSFSSMLRQKHSTYQQTFILTGFEALGEARSIYYSTQIARR
jgi:hypothetical protein